MKKLFVACVTACLMTGSAFADSFSVGIGGHPQTFKGSADEYVALIKKFGFDSTRIDYLWNEIERHKGVFDPKGNKIEQVIQKSKQNGINPLIVLGYDNPLYFSGKPTTKKNYDDFANYAGWTVHHFKNVATTYEIWNEWSTGKVSQQVGHSQQSAEDYFNLVKAASLNIKKNDPNAKVIAGSFNPLRKDERDWADKIIKLGILKYIDGFSLHPYFYKDNEAISPEQVLIGIQKAQNEFKSVSGSSRNIPFYITEIGIPTNADFHGMNFSDQYIAKYAYDLITKAKKISYIKGVWWYDLYDDGGSTKYSEHNFGIVDRDMQPKQVAISISEAIK